MVVPNTEPMDLNLIRSFVAVCEAGSVTAAAQTLNQPKSTISRHLARLEEILDKPLLDRSRTGVALTLEGKRLFEQSRDSIHFLTGLEGPSGRTSPAGHVRIAAPRYFARGPLSKIVRDFLATTPDASIECLSQSRLAEAPDDAVDILVSVGTQLNGANHVWSLGDVRAQLFAAPKLLGREPPPSVPSDLAAWPLLSSCGTIGVPETLVQRVRCPMSGSTRQKERATMRYLHTMVRVEDIDASLNFYCNLLGMVEIRRRDSEGGRFTLIFLAAPEDKEAALAHAAPMVELTYNWPDEDGSPRAIPAGAISAIWPMWSMTSTPRAQKLQDGGVTINRPPRDGHMAFVRSPDGISIELLQKGDPLPPQEPWASMANTGEW
jgi:lactoylglutathione lyase